MNKERMILSLSAVFAEQNMASQNENSVSNFGNSTNNVTIINALNEKPALHVLIANNGTATANLTSWKLTTDNNDTKNNTFIFPVFSLKPKAVVTIHAHNNANTATDLYGSNFEWNGTSDIKLFDNNGMLVSDYQFNSLPVIAV